MTLTTRSRWQKLRRRIRPPATLFLTFRLGGRRWAWTTAWLNMIGQVAITAGINIAAAIYIIGAVTRLMGLPADARVPLFGNATSWSFQLLIMVVILIPQVAINVWGIRLTARLSDISVWWHIGGVLLIVILLSASAAITIRPVPLHMAAGRCAGTAGADGRRSFVPCRSFISFLLSKRSTRRHRCSLRAGAATSGHTGYDASAHRRKRRSGAAQHSLGNRSVGRLRRLPVTDADGPDVAFRPAMSRQPDPYPVLYIFRGICPPRSPTRWRSTPCDVALGSRRSRRWRACGTRCARYKFRDATARRGRHRTPVIATIVTALSVAICPCRGVVRRDFDQHRFVFRVRVDLSQSQERLARRRRIHVPTMPLVSAAGRDQRRRVAWYLHHRLCASA